MSVRLQPTRNYRIAGIALMLAARIVIRYSETLSSDDKLRGREDLGKDANV
jgi:hypothetical protein